MERFSEKLYLQLKMPAEDIPVSDEKRIRLALDTLGYPNVTFPLPILRKLYPLCREAGFDITVTLIHREADWVIVDVEPGDTRQRYYGLAVYGTDILTRITYALENPAHVADLQNATVQTFQQLLGALTENTGIEAARCPIMIVSENTTMVHFLLKLDGWTVFASPYAPVVTDPGFFWGMELGMDFSGLMYFIPAASNYIGGDIVSGLLKLGIHKKEETSLFFDIGTNGELVIGNKEWMMAGAGAAGPALEGYISRFGMRARAGA